MTYLNDPMVSVAALFIIVVLYMIVDTVQTRRDRRYFTILHIELLMLKIAFEGAQANQKLKYQLPADKRQETKEELLAYNAFSDQLKAEYVELLEDADTYLIHSLGSPEEIERLFKVGPLEKVELFMSDTGRLLRRKTGF